MNEHHQQICQIKHSINNVASRIQQRSEAFYLTGNSDMGQFLSDEASNLYALSESLEKATGAWIADMIKASGQHSRNVLNAAMAGVLIATQPKPPKPAAP